MSQQLIVWGSTSSAISYNLNKQFVTVPKVVITPETLLEHLEESQRISQRLEELKQMNYQDYTAAIQQDNGLFNSDFSSEFYKSLQEQLKQISDDFSDIKLKDYNFMNSVSNTKYTVQLRCDDYSLSRYFVEKGSLLSSMRSLLEEYLSFTGNVFRKNRLDQFQIEVSVAEEYHKHIFLKKEQNRLVLAASFGFPRSHPFDYDIGPECYYSEGESFHLFANTQQIAQIRDQNRFKEEEIYQQEKVLGNNDLVAINDTTKNIHDALVELYITKKGQVKILHVGLLESSIPRGNERGYMMAESSKQYDRIALVTLRDNISEEYTNPKYLLLRNEQEVRELLEHLEILHELDGLVFSENCYHPLLDHFGDQLDMDVIYLKENLQKSLDVKLDKSQILLEPIDGGGKTTNPFSSIISDDTQQKQQDQFLERLKQVDLNESSQEGGGVQGDREQVSGIAESIISSPQSSTKSNPSSKGGQQQMAGTYDEQGKKRSAIEMLADTVLNNNAQPIEDNNQPQQQESRDSPAQNTEQQSTSNANTFSQNQDSRSQSDDTSYRNSQFIMDGVTGSDVKTQSQENQDVSQEQLQQYVSVLGTRLLTPPSVDSGAYFVDPNTISQVQGGEIYYVATSPDEMQNPNVNYVFPIAVGDVPTGAYALINSAEDFFLLSQAKSAELVFVNLSHVNTSIQEPFLKAHLQELNTVGVIVTYQQLPILANHINRISAVFVKDLQNQEQYQQTKETLLGYEKRFLLRESYF